MAVMLAVAATLASANAVDYYAITPTNGGTEPLNSSSISGDRVHTIITNRGESRRRLDAALCAANMV